MTESDPRQPIWDVVGPSRAYARVWRSMNAMSIEQRSSFGVSARVEGDRVIVEQDGERMIVERIEGDRYQVEATWRGIAVIATLPV